MGCFCGTVLVVGTDLFDGAGRVVCCVLVAGSCSLVLRVEAFAACSWLSTDRAPLVVKTTSFLMLRDRETAGLVGAVLMDGCVRELAMAAGGLFAALC